MNSNKAKHMACMKFLPNRSVMVSARLPLLALSKMGA